MYLRDNGYGVTDDSLKFWKEHKNSIGKITHVEVRFEPLFIDTDRDNIASEYNFVAFGYEGAIFLSGCNCGYGGTGPNGTAKILAELGLPIEKARKAMVQKTIHYDALTCEVK